MHSIKILNWIKREIALGKEGRCYTYNAFNAFVLRLSALVHVYLRYLNVYWWQSSCVLRITSSGDAVLSVMQFIFSKRITSEENASIIITLVDVGYKTTYFWINQ